MGTERMTLPATAGFIIILGGFFLMLIGKESLENKTMRMMKRVLLLNDFANQGF